MSVLLPTPPLPVIATTRLGLAGSGISARFSPKISPRAARLSRRASARRSRWRKRSSNESGMARSPVPAQEIDNLRQRCARPEDARYAHFLKLGHIPFRDDSADQDAHIVQAGLVEQVENPRDESEVGTAEETQT